jgi:hypothetical protein
MLSTAISTTSTVVSTAVSTTSTAVSTTTTAVSTTSTAVSTITGVSVDYTTGAIIAIIALIVLLAVKELLNSSHKQEHGESSKTVAVPLIVLFAVLALTVVYKALLVM